MPDSMKYKLGLGRVLVPLLAGMAFIIPVFGQEADATVESEHAKLVRAPNAIATLGNDLFGDKVNLFNGTLQFIQTDVSLPGNSQLPVSAGRRLDVGGRGNGGNGLFGYWDLDIPRIYGVFSKRDGWRRLDQSGLPSTARCSNFGAPPLYIKSAQEPGMKFQPPEYWHGNMLYVPGAGAQEILRRHSSNAVVPSDGGSNALVTKNRWVIRCLPALASTDASTPANEGGEGFLAIAPDGTQYRFDWLVSRLEQGIGKTFDFRKVSMERVEVSIFPTLITDRFGNTVRYQYDRMDKSKLLTITSADGVGNADRQLSFTYVPATNLIGTIRDGVRTWTYDYMPTWGGKQALKTVRLPDGSQWDLSDMAHASGPSLSSMDLDMRLADDDFQNCWDAQFGAFADAVSGSMVHPSGARGTFTVRPTQHGRVGAPPSCWSGGSMPFPQLYFVFSLTDKTIVGPGLHDMRWTTVYDTALEYGFECPDCPPYTPEPSKVSVTDPEGHVTRYYFGNTYNVDEGLLKRVEVSDSDSGLLRTTETTYEMSFTDPIGISDHTRVDRQFNARSFPVKEKVITQQGVSFRWQVPGVADFDTLYRPLRVTKSSSLGMSKTEVTVYHDNMSKWILGLLERVTDENSGLVPLLNSYNLSNSNLEAVTHFGALQKRFTYYPDGTLETSKDGRDSAIRYASYKRGIPRAISYPDNTSESMVVNDIGKITSLTDQNGYTTVYGYDAMGRVASITPPAGDVVGWNSTDVSFIQFNGTEYDVSAGHWRQVVNTGNARHVTIFDALWRPVYVYQADVGAEDETASWSKTEYNSKGKPTYLSYPQRSVSLIGPGTRAEYDALGRATTTSTDSEYGLIASGTRYDDNFQTTVTNGRGISTTSSFQVFDVPTEKAVTQINAPEGVVVSIPRDRFGKALSITRSGNGKSAKRSYVYDAMQRLCKTIEPETGATIVDYDLAQNVAWSASGQTLPSLGDCDRNSVSAAQKVVFSYDLMNRLETTTYGDNSPGISRKYWPDGLDKTITSGLSTWSYEYNRLRKNIAESLVYGGTTYRIRRDYDANGALTQLVYPDNTAVTYNPNALGDATQVGNFARAIRYYPNGAVQSFVYGNGVQHSLTQSVRGLPDRAVDKGVISDTYTFDQNGNVKSILDAQENISSRTMEYDDLDRLTRVYAPALWGDATYRYDALDNLTQSVLTAGAGIARTMEHNYPDPSTNRLMSLTGTAGFALDYGYDARGNIVRRGAQTYVFDLGNRMQQATGKATYIYDGLGRRISSVGNDGINRMQMYTHDGKLLYAGPTNASKTKYVYLHNHLITQVVGANPQYVHTDGLGSPVAMTDTACRIVSRTRYEPYGRTAGGTAPTIGFTGHVNDVETGLTYMQQRYYDPLAGRLMSIDPVTTDLKSGGNFNRYSYATNNPYKNVDRDGRDPEFAYGAGVGFGNMSPHDQAIWMAGERAATTEGSGSQTGFAVGQFAKEFISAPTLTAAGVTSAIAAMAVARLTHPTGGMGTSGKMTTRSGKTYHGNSTGSSATGGEPRAPMHPKTQEALDAVEKPSRSHGHCCEIDNINKALNAGDDVRGAKHGPVILHKDNSVLGPCSTCREVKRTLGVE